MRNINNQKMIYIQKNSSFSYQANADPDKNRKLQTGEAGRNAIELEDILRDYLQ